jgi:hypothetical protein
MKPKTQKLPVVAIRIRGGTLAGVWSATPIQVRLVDEDDLIAEGKSGDELDLVWDKATDKLKPIW